MALINAGVRGRHSSNVPARGVTVQNAGARFYNVAWRYGRALADAVARNSITEKIQKHTVLATKGKSPEIKELQIVDFIPKFYFLFNIIL